MEYGVEMWDWMQRKSAGTQWIGASVASISEHARRPQHVALTRRQES